MTRETTAQLVAIATFILLGLALGAVVHYNDHQTCIERLEQCNEACVITHTPTRCMKKCHYTYGLCVEKEPQ